MRQSNPLVYRVPIGLSKINPQFDSRNGSGRSGKDQIDALNNSAGRHMLERSLGVD
jgi:hypothetical protein